MSVAPRGWGRARPIALAAALLLAAARGEAQLDPLGWPSPTQESRPWTRWWWLGNAVDSAGLSRELGELAAAGFGGVEVTSIYGAKGWEDSYVDYLSPRWVELVRHAAAEADRLGMGVDLTPGSGWRMGGPRVPAEQGSVSLQLRADTIAGRGTWTAPAEGWLEGAVAVSADGRRIRIPDARWTAPPGEWVVYSALSRINGERVKRPSPGGEGLAIDVLSPTAVRSYLEDIAARLPLEGENVRAFMHDSYEYTGDGSRALFETFRDRRGYDLAAWIPELAGSGDPQVVARVRSDYRQTVSDMVLDHLVVPFTRWSHDRGAVSRVQAHGSPGNLLDLYAAADIPETEIFGPLEGPDSDPLVSKFASSAAHLTGKRLVAAEGMTWLGEHFTVTLADARRALDQLFVSGVNHVVYHGTAYSPEDAEWPGWLFYASTQFNPRNAIWRDIPALNRYVQRVQSLLQEGRHDSDVLLYWPIFDSWQDGDRLRVDFRVHEPNWLRAMPVGRVADWLWQSGYGFDYVSDRLLEDAVGPREGGVTAGGDEYDAIVVPQTHYMPARTMQRLLDLAAGGATVVFHGELPADVPGLDRLEQRRAELAELRSRVRLGPADAAGLRRASLGRGLVLVGPRLEPLLQAAGVAREEMTDHRGLRFIRKRAPEGYVYFVQNSGPEPLDAWLPLAVSAAAVGIMEPLTGRMGLARSRVGAGGRREVYLQLDRGGSLVLRTFDRPTEAPPWSYVDPQAGPVPLRGTWSVGFVAGGPELPAPFDTDSLGSWTARGADAERFAGTARYRLVFDDPGIAAEYVLDLGRVAESARVSLNGVELGTLVGPTFRVATDKLRRTGNVLEVEVTNLSANRIRDLDRRGVEWKRFHDINFVGIDYRPFDASGWPIRESGLLGPVRLLPVLGR